MADIFISYKREEQAIARRLADALETEGWAVWWDPKLQTGEDFEDAIEAALDDAKCVIVLWSALSVASDFVKDEARYARDNNKLLPVSIEEVSLPFRFRGLHTIQLTDWDGGRESTEFNKLLTDIASILGHPPTKPSHEEERSEPAADASHPDDVRVVRGDRAASTPTTWPRTPIIASLLGIVLIGLIWFMWYQIDKRGNVRALNNLWLSDGYQFCRDAISGRYPVDRDATADIRSDDFGAFFGPGGKIDAFLGKLADAEEPVQMSADASTQFDRAKVIKDVFFRSGNNRPVVGFDLRPVRMDATISRFTLDLEGQQVSYSHGPQITSSLQWPGPEWPKEVRIRMTPQSGPPSTRVEEGPWAWLRLLDSSDLKPGSTPESFELNFTLGDRSVAYRLTARSAYNAFNLPELGEFRCPQQMLD